MDTKENLTKYGLFCYDTENIGDEIQSIAARRFLPQIDYYINRDNIDNSKFKSNQTVKLIMNAWYMSPSIIDGAVHWPPKNQSQLKPLLVSIHINSNNGTTEIFRNPQSIAYLKKQGKIGCRDNKTLDYLKSIGIKNAYFSGCLTLTLLPDKNVSKKDFVLAVDVSDAVYKKIQERTKRQIIRIDTTHSKKLNREQKFKLAEYWLYLYQSAHCIVTHRLHAMLPSLALGTPLIALSGRDQERYSGLIELTNHYTEKTFLEKNISIDAPKENPKTYLDIRNKLIKICKDYTGYDSEASYIRTIDPKNPEKDLELMSIFLESLGDSYKLERANERINEMEKEITNKNEQLWEDQKIINEYTAPGIKKSFSLLTKALKRKITKQKTK